MAPVPATMPLLFGYLPAFASLVHRFIPTAKHAFRIAVAPTMSAAPAAFINTTSRILPVWRRCAEMELLLAVKTAMTATQYQATDAAMLARWRQTSTVWDCLVYAQ
jgi:hypothetical protein